ncbi:MAG: hypothetical protein ACKO37_06215 [Vampirovibrionales bacterium]
MMRVSMIHVRFLFTRLLAFTIGLLTFCTPYSFAEFPSSAPPSSSEKEASVSVKSQPFKMILATSPTGGEMLEFEIPGNWHLANKTQTKDRLLCEFVKEGQGIENWSELITVSVFRGLSAKYDFFKNNLLTSIEETARTQGGTFQASFFKEADRDALYSWKVSGVVQPKGFVENQEVIGRIKARPQASGGVGNLYEVSYASKSVFLDDPLQKKQWLDFLEKVKIYNFFIKTTSRHAAPTFFQEAKPL